jgi:hypothetical protein
MVQQNKAFFALFLTQSRIFNGELEKWERDALLGNLAAKRE